MRGVWGLLFNRLLYNPGPLPCADGGNPAASRRVLLNTSQSMFGETSTPSANLLKRHLQPCCNLLVPQTLSRQQHNSGSFRQPYRCTPASPQSFQFLSYLNIKINPRCFPHIYIRRWTSTYISLILADYTSSPRMTASYPARHGSSRHTLAPPGHFERRCRRCAEDLNVVLFSRIILYCFGLCVYTSDMIRHSPSFLTRWNASTPSASYSPMSSVYRVQTAAMLWST